MDDPLQTHPAQRGRQRLAEYMLALSLPLSPNFARFSHTSLTSFSLLLRPSLFRLILESVLVGLPAFFPAAPPAVLSNRLHNLVGSHHYPENQRPSNEMHLHPRAAHSPVEPTPTTSNAQGCRESLSPNLHLSEIHLSIASAFCLQLQLPTPLDSSMLRHATRALEPLTRASPIFHAHLKVYLYRSSSCP